MQKHKQWLCYAEEDLRSAIKLLDDNYPMINTSLYHSHQCAEKSFKAYLAYNKKQIVKTHDLLKLLNCCTLLDEEFHTLNKFASRLNPFSTKTRYPEDCFNLDLTTAKVSTEEAKQIFDFVLNKI